MQSNNTINLDNVKSNEELFELLNKHKKARSIPMVKLQVRETPNRPENKEYLIQQLITKRE